MLGGWDCSFTQQRDRIPDSESTVPLGSAASISSTEKLSNPNFFSNLVVLSFSNIKLNLFYTNINPMMLYKDIMAYLIS